MELVFLRQLVKMVDEFDLDKTSVPFFEMHGDEEFVGVVENDDLKKLIMLHEKLKEEIVEKGLADVKLYLEDVETALEGMANPDDADVNVLGRCVRNQVIRTNQRLFRGLRYQIIEKSLTYALFTVFPDIRGIDVIYFRQGWKVTKKKSASPD